MSTNQVTINRSVNQPRNKSVATNELVTVSRSKLKREAMRANNTTILTTPSIKMQKQEFFKENKNAYVKLRKEQAMLMTRLKSQKTTRYEYYEDDA